MTIPVLIDLLVARIPYPGAEPSTGHPPFLSLADADAVTAAAQDAGVTAVRLLDAADGTTALDPTVVTAYLAGRHPQIGYLADVLTTHNAPYNLARRVLSTDRATEGRFGLVLRVGDGDEVSDAVLADRGLIDRTERWSEYAQVLTELWHSFPRRALLGDQGNALVVDDSLIRPISHDGVVYRVAGPLDGPSSVQGRPVLVAADLDELGWAAVAASADVVVLERAQVVGADLALTRALERAGRSRSEIALVGRVAASPTEDPSTTADQLRSWAAGLSLDGIALVPSGTAADIVTVVRTLVPALDPAHGPTLRSALGLPVPIGVSA